jgi:hypothetical protein
MPTHRELPIDWQVIHARRQAEVDAADGRARESRRRAARGMPPLPPYPPPMNAASQPPRSPRQAAKGLPRRSRILDVSAGFLLSLAVVTLVVVISRDEAHPGFFAAHRTTIGAVLSALVGVAGTALYYNQRSSH